jgi:hypothetical protein
VHTGIASALSGIEMIADATGIMDPHGKDRAEASSYRW